jgi:alkanesulfonate monooxygenase SsuD/methylene tetrahydromethanopterin reductase-like flavin-dependent oxidoreductase (luciferase family)
MLIPSHIVVPDGEAAELVGRSWPDNVVLTTHLAARTSKLRLHFAGLIVPYHRPIWVARVLRRSTRRLGAVST